LKGSNLVRTGDVRVWQNSDFVNNEMPTQLDGVSVTVNGKNAFIYYVSATQINVLTPPDPLTGAVSVQLTVDSQPSNAVQVQTHAVSPSFFELVSNAAIHYVFGRHVDYSLIGPLSLYPGASTPVRPGETILVAATGLGPTDVPIVNGSLNQTGIVRDQLRVWQACRLF